MANRNKNVMQKGKGNPKFRKSKNKGSSSYEPREEAQSDVAYNTNPNDVNWYVVDDQILNDVARIPYSIPVGMPFTRLGSFVPSGVQLPAYDDAIPGIMASFVLPVLGNARNAGDAVNVAANSVYQYVRSRISGSRPYDAVDMMIYLGAMDSLYCYVTWLTRLYATVFTYHQANRYLSRGLIEAQGVNYNDLVSNLAQFRAYVNTTIAKVQALYLPSILPIFKRHSWLFKAYYIEGPSEKDQIYMHVPSGVHQFQYDSTGAGKLKAINIHTGSPLTVANLLSTLDSLIDPIYADEDFNRISGDFLKAYEGNVMTLTELPDIATMNLTYNESVLLQFKNAKYKYVLSSTTMGALSPTWLGDSFDYEQDPTKTFLTMKMSTTALDNYMVIDPTNNEAKPVTSASGATVRNILATMYYDWSKETLLTSPSPSVTPAETMENTRLSLAFNISSNPSAIGQCTINDMFFGTEWPMEYRLYTFHRNRSTGVLTMFFRRYDSHGTIGFGGGDFSHIESYVLSQEPIRSAFKYLPELTLIYSDEYAPKVVDPGRPQFEVDNYALVHANTIGALHNAAILGEYNIPKLAIGH